MKKGFFILLIFCFSLTIISCSDEKEEYSSTGTTAPVIAEVTAVTTPTNDTTPNYTFSSTEAGTITYGGSCSSGTTSATSGNNTITFASLSDGTFSNCTITVKDSAENVSNTLEITSFTIDISLPVFVGVGDDRIIVRLTDNGASWDNVTSPTSNSLRGVGFGNNTFVGVGTSGTIVRSTDNGSSFSTVTSPISKYFTSIAFGNNTFVGVGEYGETGIVRSTDNGSSFSTVTSPTSEYLYGVVFSE